MYLELISSGKLLPDDERADVETGVLGKLGGCCPMFVSATVVQMLDSYCT